SMFLPIPEANCQDGLDDDGDGAVDCEDPDCQPERRLAKLADPGVRFVRGVEGEALILYQARSSTASVRNYEAIVVDAHGQLVGATPEAVYETTIAVNVDAVALPGGGYAAVFNPVGTGRLELAMLDRAGAITSLVTLDETVASRPLISFAADPGGTGLAILRG